MYTNVKFLTHFTFYTQIRLDSYLLLCLLGHFRFLHQKFQKKNVQTNTKFKKFKQFQILQKNIRFQKFQKIKKFKKIKKNHSNFGL